MNLNRLLRPALLVFFVLLQCMSPFAHAHVNGDHTDQHAHLAVTNDHHHHADAVQLSDAEHHAAVVCPPPESRNSGMVIDEAAATNKHDTFVLQEASALTAAGFYSPPLLFISYQYPFSQAPPV